MVLPPPLAWLPDVADSLSRALGCSVSYQLRPTVNALVYILVLRFSAPQEPRFTGQVWNLIQMYAARNDAIPQGVESEPLEMRISIGMKRRLGPPKREAPWG